jgi:hypothetical protein
MRGRIEEKRGDCRAALVFAPGENFCFAGESHGVVTAALNIAEIFVAHVLHARLAYIPRE